MTMLLPGDPAPYFTAPALGGNPAYAFHTVAGRAVVMLFLGPGGGAAQHAALDAITRHADRLDDARATLFGISVDPRDVERRRVAPRLPGIRWLLDPERQISALYGASAGTDYHPHWLVLDRTLRVVARLPIEAGGAAFAALDGLLASTQEPEIAPVLTVPRVFDHSLCRRLIAVYETGDAAPSGFMREEGGVTVLRSDPQHKRRDDVVIRDEALRGDIAARLERFLFPQIARAFQFRVTRIERWLVGGYDAEAGGHFKPHRDNTTSGTAHRRFACTINLNAEDYDGGDLVFPEYGARRYRAPTGGAVIFSCSLLHEVVPMVRGRRYAFLPFFYDEAAAQIREANMARVAPELAGYRA